MSCSGVRSGLFVLHLDEDTQGRFLAAALEALGLAVHMSGPSGMDRSPDADQLRFTTDRGWVIYTSNTRDFAVLHRDWLNAGQSHAGIIYRTRQQWSIGEQSRRIERTWRTLSAAEMVNRYESLSQWGEDAGPAS